MLHSIHATHHPRLCIAMLAALLLVQCGPPGLPPPDGTTDGLPSTDANTDGERCPSACQGLPCDTSGCRLCIPESECMRDCTGRLCGTFGCIAGSGCSCAGVRCGIAGCFGMGCSCAGVTCGTFSCPPGSPGCI